MFLPVLFLLAALSSAQDLDSAARELARKIPVQEITNLTVRNTSSLAPADVARVSRTLQTELHIRHRLGGAMANVTLSENLQSYLWVAEILRGEERQVIMLHVARPAAPGASPAAVTIEKKLLWEQDRPILDVAIAGSLMVILDPISITLYRDRRLTQSLPIVTARPMPRDPRGRVTVDHETFRAFLPGVVCEGVITSPGMTCADSNAPWPLEGGAELAAGRNYFIDPRVPAYFSSASLPGRRLLAGIDGRVHIYDSALHELTQVSGWGSDLAAVESSCGRQILASRPGDSGEPDVIQVFDAAATDPAHFPGPVVALWPSEQSSVVVVARNSETGRYAAYSLAITCDR